MENQKQRIYDELNKMNIKYEAVEHEPVHTMEDMDRLGLPEKGTLCKNLFLRDSKGKRHFLVVIRADKQANLKELGEKLGVGKLSFASEERLEKYMGLKKGAVSPLGVLNDENCAVEVFFDEDFTKMPRIGVHPNENTASVYLSSEDLLRVIREHGNRLEIVSFA